MKDDPSSLLARGEARRSPTLLGRWEAAARLLEEHRDVLDERPDAGIGSGSLDRRGWAAFLTALEEDALAAIEIDGHDAVWPDATPPTLLELVDRVRSACALPALLTARGSITARPARRHEKPRKRAQVDAFARLILPLAASAGRVVDVGSGHGHLTRELAERLDRPVVGLERDGDLARRARSLSVEGVGPSVPSFAVTDVLEDGLALEPDDCVVGLHACGDLGDAIVVNAARTRASIALVGCCLQKRRASVRRPLCGGERTALHLPRSLLGLSNLFVRDEGVEASRAENLIGRERRLALHRLLSESGIELRVGAEIEGLNRRAAQLDLTILVARGFAIRRLPPPSRERVAAASRWAKAEHARTRRLSLPRVLLARVLEIFVVLDRARYLEERGFTMAVGTVFSPSVSARNLVLFGVHGRTAAR